MTDQPTRLEPGTVDPSSDAPATNGSPAEPNPAMREFARLFLKEKKLDEELKRTARRRGELKDAAEAELLSLGLERAPLSMGATVYRDERIYCGPVKKVDDGVELDEPDWPKTVAALKGAGLGHMVQETANHQTLAAWLKREYEQAVKDAREEAVAERAKNVETARAAAAERGEDPDDVDVDAIGPDPDLVFVELEDVIPPELRDALSFGTVTNLKAVKSGS